MRSVMLGWALWTALALPVGAQSAAECGLSPGDPYETFPGDGALAVASDAPIRVRLAQSRAAPSAEELATALSLHEVTVNSDKTQTLGPGLPGTLYFVGGDTFWFEPDAPLQGGLHQLRLSPVIVSTAPVVTFTVGKADSGPPAFRDDWEAEVLSVLALPESCGAAAGTHRVELFFIGARDDADEGAIEYLVYLTRARQLRGPRLVARTRLEGTALDPSARFMLSSEEMLEPVCVAVVAVDGVLNQTHQGDEYCFDPADMAFFHPMCRALPGGPGGRSAVPVTAVFLVPLALLRRRAIRRALRSR